MFQLGSSFESLNMMVDVALYCALGFLALRFLLSSSMSVGRGAGAGAGTQKLESSLRKLIKEAEHAGRALNDQLARRQRTLQRLLDEIEGGEQRLRELMSSIQEAESELQFQGQVVEEAHRERTDYSEPYYMREPMSFESEPPSFESGGQPAYAHGNQHQTHQTQSDHTHSTSAPIEQGTSLIDQVEKESELPETEESWDDVNIYGEPIGEAPSVSTEPKMVRGSAQERLQQVYDAAEELLRAGNDVESVAARTALPPGEVQSILHSMAVMDHEFEEESDESDPRLGVLGGIKRQVETL